MQLSHSTAGTIQSPSVGRFEEVGTDKNMLPNTKVNSAAALSWNQLEPWPGPAGSSRSRVESIDDKELTGANKANPR